jgi:hypothetical protein
MNEQEKGMIEGLFQRLRQAESQMGKRDAEAEALINGFMTRQSAAPYLLSQVVLVQEQGLKNLQAQVEELERQLAERPQGGGGFLGGLFGGTSQPAAPAQARPAASGGWGNSPAGAQGLTRGGMGAAQQPGAQGGGFMAGALQTAMGVAGGVLLGNAIAGMFSSPAEAAESTAPAEPEAAPEEPVAEEGGDFFDGFFGGGSDEGGGGEEW